MTRVFFRPASECQDKKKIPSIFGGGVSTSLTREQKTSDVDLFFRSGTTRIRFVNRRLNVVFFLMPRWANYASLKAAPRVAKRLYGGVYRASTQQRTGLDANRQLFSDLMVIKRSSCKTNAKSYSLTPSHRLNQEYHRIPNAPSSVRRFSQRLYLEQTMNFLNTIKLYRIYKVLMQTFDGFRTFHQRNLNNSVITIF